MRKLILICLLALATISCHSSENILTGGKVVAHSGYPPFVSGIITTWVELVVEDRIKKRYYFYTPFLGKENLPEVGKIYDFYFRYEDINGFVGDSEKELQKVKIIDKFDLVAEEWD